MVKATQPNNIQNAVLRAGILTDEAISCGTLSKGSKKRKANDEGTKSGGSWKDKKKAKVGAGFVAKAPPRMICDLPNVTCVILTIRRRKTVECVQLSETGHFARLSEPKRAVR
ncbi:hypothetical protein Tco_0138024 [Tanacetum coccineum]